MIDIKLFKEVYQEIEEKVQKIRVLPMLYSQEQDYMGFEFEDDEICINSEYHYPGCGTDHSSLYIPIDEIGNSVEWFKEKFQKEIDEAKRKELEYKKAEKARVKQNRVNAKENQRKADLATYRRIKKQLGK